MLVTVERDGGMLIRSKGIKRLKGETWEAKDTRL